MARFADVRRDGETPGVEESAGILLNTQQRQHNATRDSGYKHSGQIRTHAVEDQVVVYLPSNWGLRFSRNAFNPS
jgi:hypothetical protein